MINLHAVVRPIITTLHPDEVVTLYQSVGQVNTLGRIAAKYAEGQTVQAQIQTLSADELQQNDAFSRTGIHRKAYLYCPVESMPPTGIVRVLARNGDFIQRADGTWWLVVSLLEDFSKSEWVCVGITQQIKAPDFSASDWYGNGGDA